MTTVEEYKCMFHNADLRVTVEDCLVTGFISTANCPLEDEELELFQCRFHSVKEGINTQTIEVDKNYRLPFDRFKEIILAEDGYVKEAAK